MIKTYKCENCGEFDIDLKLADGELKECPTCNEPVRRVWQPTPSIWKTSGAFGKSNREK